MSTEDPAMSLETRFRGTSNALWRIVRFEAMRAREASGYLIGHTTERDPGNIAALDVASSVRDTAIYAMDPGVLVLICLAEAIGPIWESEMALLP